MGTNVYAYRKLDKDFIKDREDFLKDITKTVNFTLDVSEFEDLTYNFKKRLLEQVVHLGKSSYGHKFLLNGNNKKYYSWNKDSIMKFLTEDCYKIVDEDGHTYTPEEFWEIFVVTKLFYVKTLPESETGFEREHYDDSEGINEFFNVSSSTEFS